jgi:hypothetical protein
MFTTQSLDSNSLSHEFVRDFNILYFGIQHRAFGCSFTPAVRYFETWVHFYMTTRRLEINSINLPLYLLTVQFITSHLLGLM